METIVKFILESIHGGTKDVGCYKSSVSKTWYKYKKYEINGLVKKGRHTGRSRKISNRQDRKLYVLKIENVQQSK